MYPSLDKPSIYPALNPTTPSSRTQSVQSLTQRVQSAAQNVPLSHQPQRAQPGALTLPFSQGLNSAHDYCMHAKDHSPFGTTSEGGRQYFTPPSEPGTPVGMARRSRSLSGESNFWAPVGKTQADSNAALLGAQLTAQQKVQQSSAANRPGMIAVIQDPTGNSIGGMSVRRRDQDRWESARNPYQTIVLDLIPPSIRGKGNGNCAEQVVLHKALRLEEQNRFQVAQSRITAIGTGKRDGILTPACGSCQFTNAVFELQDTVRHATQSGTTLLNTSSLRPRTSSSISQGWESPLSSRSSTSSFLSTTSRKSSFRS